jgi:TATA-box binding protein (TBP) (component of TFIID and TFIIIB)
MILYAELPMYRRIRSGPESKRARNWSKIRVYTEYEPEQFPGLVFWPDDHPVVILVFASGKVVVTGAKDINAAEEAFQSLKEDLDALV